MAKKSLTKLTTDELFAWIPVDPRGARRRKATDTAETDDEFSGEIVPRRCIPSGKRTTSQCRVD